jgi:glycosyltransferase involved in cell wall biosynthesis
MPGKMVNSLEIVEPKPLTADPGLDGVSLPPLVSIGLPVFNGEQFLEQCLDSILRQTHRDVELIISDNASTDGTENICRRYAERDARIVYHRQPRNHGVTWNFRQVALLARGEYFLWMAHDDFLAPEYVEYCLTSLQNHRESVLCYSKAVEVDEHGNHLARKEQVLRADTPSAHERFRELIRMEHNCESIFGLIRTDVLKKTSIHGDFPDSDRCVLAELALYGTFTKLPQYLFFHREHAQRVTKQFPTRQERMFRLNPDRRLRLVFPHFRQLREYVEAIHRSPLNFRERWSCYRHLLHWGSAYKSRLLADLTYAVVRTLRPVRGWFKRSGSSRGKHNAAA